MQVQERFDSYRRPIRSNLHAINLELVKYFDKNKILPSTLEDLPKRQWEKEINPNKLEAPVNDGINFFGTGGTQYFLPYLYNTELLKNYKEAPEDAILVASPRFRGKRYVLLLKDIINKDPNRYEVVSVMSENKFQEYAKKYNWQVPPQPPDNRTK